MGVDRFLAALDEHLIPQLNQMRRGAGYNRDYSNVVKELYPWSQEKKVDRPHIMLDVATQPSPISPGGVIGIGELGSKRIRLLNVIVAGVHYRASKTSSGLDVIGPYYEIRADIHRAMYENRRAGGRAWMAIYWMESTTLPAPEGYDGGTVLEQYGILTEYDSGDLSRYPGEA